MDHSAASLTLSQTASVEAATGILAGTTLLTLDGELPVEFLTPGDRVITRSGVRVLAQVTGRAVSDFAAVEILPGTLGHDRPGQALVIGADQMVLVRDWRAQALYGAAQALVPAHRLADGHYIRRVTLAQAQVFTLTFTAGETVYAEGVELGFPAAVPA